MITVLLLTIQKEIKYNKREKCSNSLTDRIAVSGTVDAGSTPAWSANEEKLPSTYEQ